MFLMKERICKLIEDVHGLVCSDRRPVEEYRMKRSDGRLSDPVSEDTRAWEKITSRDIWGGHREYFYFETVITIPSEWAGRRVVYELRTGKEGGWDAVNPQFLAYVNGTRRMGLDVNHREILLSACAQAGEQFRLLLSAFSGDNNFSLHLDSEIQVLEPEVEAYYYDLAVPYGVARLLPEDDGNRRTILQSLNASLNLLDLRKPYSPAFFESLRSAREYLNREFYEKACGGWAPTVYCVGHTHIDVAWLWTLRVTRDKAVRSFSTVLELMKQYPEYKFMSSQPQLYKYVKEQAPEIYEQIRERIAQGRWEAEGGMFVEADCNLASGEALARQFLYGIRFFKQEFGVENKVLWLPDVFGYSAALPQIMKKCGISYFMTTKISWNEQNKMPYDTFLWEGIDGTEILTHFIPTRDYGAKAQEGGTETEHFTTYNGNLNPSQVMGGWQRYSQKELNSEVLMSYGYGDGGGGVTKEMLENQRRLSRGIPGAPRTVQSTAREFFETLDEQVRGKRELPKWVGELYLEYHRGTYTSMARNKRCNRRAEFACTDLELYSVLAEQAAGLAYPQEELARIWEILLRNQFHDILPGSSIKEVYEDSQKEYRELFAVSDRLTKKALDTVTNRIAGEAGTVVVYNPNSQSVPAPVILPWKADGQPAFLRDGGRLIPLQRVEDGLLAVVDQIPSKGYRTFVPVQGEAAGADADWLRISETEVETPYIVAELNEKGQFTRIYDKQAGRELIPEGACGNVLMTYEDHPHNFDAWDINNYYTEKSWEADQITDIQVTERGPVRGCIRIERKYLDSVIVQHLYFYRDLCQIDIRNEIDWKEKQILLRAYFPVDVHAEEATYEIQYGNVKRPTHFNTSWDQARFEVCAHKWIDISEDGYGLSVLNDCKYGCDIHHGVIGLTMLKSGIYPNPDADKEHHCFTWSLCPHQGSWRQSGTAAKAYLLNNPYTAAVKAEDGGSLPDTGSFVTADAENVIIEAVKKAEDGDGTIIRLYEYWNRRGSVTLKFAGPVSRAVICNMLEEEEEELEVSENSVTFAVAPYEIKTIKI